VHDAGVGTPGVSPRALATLLRFAVRYAAGRFTGAYSYPAALASSVASSLTAGEREALIAEVERALAITVEQNDANSAALRNDGQEASWRSLLEALRNQSGEGSEAAVDSAAFSARRLDLTAGWAIRRALGQDGARDLSDEEKQQVVHAVRAVATYLTPGDRALMLRDLRDQFHGPFARDDAADEDAPEPWRSLYTELRGMEVDEHTADFYRLPATI
jgi:hypothetical protein